MSAELNRLSTINSLMRVENLLDVVLALGYKRVLVLTVLCQLRCRGLKNDKDYKDRC